MQAGRYWLGTAAETWRRVWGDGKISEWRFWGKKFQYSRPKILMTFFSHRPGFSDFDSLSSDSPYLYCVKCRRPIIIWPFLHKEKHYLRKEFLDWHLFSTLFDLSRPFHNTTSKNIGGTNAWAVPHLKFWGTVPPVPLGLRPWVLK